MAKRVYYVIFLLAAVALPVGGIYGTARAQSRSLEDLQADIRASVRRDMGLGAAPAYTQKAVKAEPQTAASSGEKDKFDMTGNVPRAHLVLAVVITAVVTFMLTKILGGVGRKSKKASPENAPEKDRRKEEDRAFEEKTSIREKERTEIKEETAIDIYEKIERVQALRNRGIISEEEFSSKKKQLLDRI